MTSVQVSDAVFTSRAFRSAEEMEYRSIGQDGVAMATADEAKAGAFLQSFAGGDFSLTVKTASDAGAESTYLIATGPSAQVQNDFAACVETLMPGPPAGNETSAKSALLVSTILRQHAAADRNR